MATKRKKRDMMQTVWIVFSDGEKAGYIGRAATKTNDRRTIKDISFTEPRELPEGHSFGEIGK